MNTTTIPRWGQWATGGTMLAVALTAGTLGLVLNVSHGLEAGLAAGIAFGLADVGKIIIPIVAGVIGWSTQMRATAVICVLVSVFCAVNYYADHSGRDLIAKQHGETVYADKAKAIAELEAEASRLSALAAEEAKRGGCKQNCRALMVQASEARQRLDTARTLRADAKPVEASGLAVMVSMASGAKADNVVRSIGAVTAALFLALIELLVWLSVPAMRLLSQAAKKSEPVVEQVAVKKPAAKRKKAAARKPKSKKDWTKLDAYAKAPLAFNKPDRRRKAMRPTNDNVTA